MKISIIIPVYNGEKNIYQCYDSLVKQKYAKWEAIFIDDGSSDGSVGILKQICEMDNRCSYISEPNSKQMVARYNGIDMATGDYCAFLDVDDTLESNALDEIDTIASRFNPDIIMFNGIRIDRSTGEKYKMWDHLSETPHFYKNEEYKKLRWLAIDGRRLNNICFKAIKTTILKKSKAYTDCKFIRNEEDLLMQLPYLDLANNLFYIPLNLYLYTVNEKSSSKTYDENFYKSSCFIYHELLKYGAKWKADDYKRKCNTKICEAAIFSVISGCEYLSKSNWYNIVTRIVESKEFQKASRFSHNHMSLTKKVFAQAMRFHANCIVYFISKYEILHGYDS